MSVRSVAPAGVVRVCLVASMFLVGACAHLGGVVKSRSNAVSGLITEDDLRVSVDTVVRNACPRMVGDSVRTQGVVAVRVSQDIFDQEIRARIVKSSGDTHVDETIADLASQLPPRFRDQAQQMYTLRYDLAVRYSCARDSYGVTGEAAVSL